MSKTYASFPQSRNGLGSKALEHLELSSTKIITHGSITRQLCEGEKKEIHKNKKKLKAYNNTAPM